MPLLGSALYQIPKFALAQLLAQPTTILVLLAAVLVFRTYRERYLLCWIIGWLSYLLFELSQSAFGLYPESRTLHAVSIVSFVAAVLLFACAVFFYTGKKHLIAPSAAVAQAALAVALVHVIWFPRNLLVIIALHTLYRIISLAAAWQLVVFSRGRRSLGAWLMAIMLVLLHIDENPGVSHAWLAVDTGIELLLGLSMMILVLDDSKLRTRRLGVLSAITAAIAQARDTDSMMLEALKELRSLMDARAAWFRLLEGDRLVMSQQIGLPESFLRDRWSIDFGDLYINKVMREGAAAKVRTSLLDPVAQGQLNEAGFDHTVLVPVKGKNSIIGVLALGYERSRTYTPEDMRFLAGAANQLGIAVENLHMLEQILRSQRHWKGTFDSIQDYILVHDEKFQILRVNRALLRRLKKATTQVVNQSCESVLPKTEPGWKDCPYCSRGESEFAEAPDPCFGGFSLVSTSSFTEEGEEVLGAVHIIQDTTERRAAEEKYRLLFEQVQEGVFISTPEGRLIDCNEAFVRLLGYGTREELLSLDVAKSLWALPEQREVFRERMSRDSYVRNYEVALRKKDGTALTVLETSFATRNASGEVERYQGFVLDITEKKRAEEQIRRRNRELHVLNSLAVIATQSFDLDEILNLTLRLVIDLFGADTGSVHLFDEKGATLSRRAAWGHRSETAVSSSELKITPEFVEQVRRSHIEVLTQQHMKRLPEAVVEVVRAEGLRSWIWVVMWNKEKIVGMFGVACRTLREFTSMDENLMVAIGRQLATTIERIRLYEETCRAYEDLRKTQEQLLQSEKMSAIGQLIAGVAHELNNPLTAILGYAQLLESEGLPERSQDFVQKLHRQAQRTQRVVQNLLSFARQHKPHRYQVDVRRVMDDTLALRDYDLKLHGISVERDFDSPLPAVVADPHQMEQVFLNIINNAVDAMLEVSQGGRLRVRIFAEGNSVCAEFRDSGPGLTDTKHIFDPFYTTKGVGKGTGLGLSICYGIVKEHEGEIVAGNHPEGGAVFLVKLPAAQILPKIDDKLPVAVRAEVLLQGRVLVMDEEEAVLEFEREVLVGAGAEVVTANHIDRALLVLQKDGFDAVILGGGMAGGRSGVEVYRWIAKHRPELKGRVIFAAANMADPVTKAFLAETKIPCIVKPFEVGDLIVIVRRALRPAAAAVVGN